MIKAKFLFILSLVLIVAAFAAGWWLGSRSEDARVANRATEREAVSHALNAATFINMAWQTIETASPETRDRRRKNLLISELLYLARAEPYGSEFQEDTFVMHADQALDLLGVKNQDELMHVVENAGLINSVTAPFLDPNDNEHNVIIDFIDRAFQRQKSQPHFPARVWLDAVINEDPDLLSTAYSDRVASENPDWRNQLGEYRQQLAKDLGELDPQRFSFSYSTSLDQEGEVIVSYEEKKYHTFKIIRDGTGWRLDEF